MGEKSSLWKELEKIVLEAYLSFKLNLQTVPKEPITVNDWRTAILIKLGITPTQMSVLLNLTKGGIVSRRERLSEKIFGYYIGPKRIDRVMRLL